MEQYIKKSALVAEIDKGINGRNDWQLDEYRKGYHDALTMLKKYLSTLEVKEIDFDAEWKRYFEHRGEMATVNVKHLAKHFFELGMAVSNKAQKGEKV